MVNEWYPEGHHGKGLLGGEHLKAFVLLRMGRDDGGLGELECGFIQLRDLVWLAITVSLNWLKKTGLLEDDGSLVQPFTHSEHLLL